MRTFRRYIWTHGGREIFKFLKMFLAGFFGLILLFASMAGIIAATCSVGAVYGPSLGGLVLLAGMALIITVIIIASEAI